MSSPYHVLTAPVPGSEANLSQADLASRHPLDSDTLMVVDSILFNPSVDHDVATLAKPSVIVPVAIRPYSSFEEALFVVDIAVLVASFLGNVGVVYYICGQKRARTTHNITIVSMAAADLLTVMFVMPTYLLIWRREAMADSAAQLLCKLNKYMWNWNKTVIIYSMLAMVIDRYLKVSRPYKISTMTGRCMFFLNFVWFFGASYNIWKIILNTCSLVTVDVLGDTSSVPNVTLRRCFVTHSPTYSYLPELFLFGDTLVIYVFPCMTIIILYNLIFIKVYRTGDSRLMTSGRRKLLMSVFLFLLFYACHLPLHVNQGENLMRPSRITPWSVSLTTVLETVSFSQGLLFVVAYVSCSAELQRSLWGASTQPVTTATCARTTRVALHTSNSDSPAIVVSTLEMEAVSGSQAI